MNLKEYQERFGIKRINFDKVHRTDLDETDGTDNVICPYCGYEFEIEAEDIDSVLRGTVMTCGECDKNFYVEGEATINTTCTPMADAVINNRRHIESAYNHSDECDKNGMDFPESRYGFVEWETYRDWARPLFENGESE